MTIGGDFTQSAGARFFVELGGETAGSEYDQMQVAGRADLDGTLEVWIIGGHTVASDASYEIITFGSRTGDFTTKTGLDLGGGDYLATLFSPTGYFLVEGAVNTAPVLADTDLVHYVPKDVPEASNAGIPISDLAGGISDADGVSVRGVAVTAIGNCRAFLANCYINTIYRVAFFKIFALINNCINCNCSFTCLAVANN